MLMRMYIAPHVTTDTFFDSSHAVEIRRLEEKAMYSIIGVLVGQVYLPEIIVFLIIKGAIILF